MRYGRFFVTGDGQLNGVLLAGFIYLLLAVGDLYMYGWRSHRWMATLLLSVGFMGMSAHDARTRPRGSQWRSPTYVLGMASALLGLCISTYACLSSSR